MNMTYDEKEIEKILQNRVEGVKNRDVIKATEDYSEDVQLFDIVDPLEHSGKAALQNRLHTWLASLKTISDYEISDLKIHLVPELAFCTCFVHIDAINTEGKKLDMWWRETICISKDGGRWKIIHAHSSVPFNPVTGIPSIGLLPDKRK